MNHLIHCSCGEVIVKSGADTKVRSKILVFKDDGAYAVCKSCDREVSVPLQLNADLLKSMASVDVAKSHVPLYIRNFRSTGKSS